MGKQPRKRQQAFTLIELMIVIAIIGILAAIAIPAYLDFTIRSQIAEGLNLSSGAKAAVTEYFQEHGVYPTDNGQAGLEEATEIQGNYIEAVTVSSDTVTLRYGNDANGQINGETVRLTAVERDGSLTWDCASGGVIEYKHLPGACR